MNLQLKFIDSKPSEELTQYAEDRFRKLKKFEMKPISVSLALNVERHKFVVKAHLRGKDIEIRATAEGDNFYDAIDSVLHRCQRQLSRKKSKVQNHKCHWRTREERLERLNPDMGTDETLTADTFDEAA